MACRCTGIKHNATYYTRDLWIQHQRQRRAVAQRLSHSRVGKVTEFFTSFVMLSGSQLWFRNETHLPCSPIEFAHIKWLIWFNLMVAECCDELVMWYILFDIWLRTFSDSGNNDIRAYEDLNQFHGIINDMVSETCTGLPSPVCCRELYGISFRLSKHITAMLFFLARIYTQNPLRFGRRAIWSGKMERDKVGIDAKAFTCSSA